MREEFTTTAVQSDPLYPIGRTLELPIRRIALCLVLACRDGIAVHRDRCGIGEGDEDRVLDVGTVSGETILVGELIYDLGSGQSLGGTLHRSRNIQGLCLGISNNGTIEFKACE